MMGGIPYIALVSNREGIKEYTPYYYICINRAYKYHGASSAPPPMSWHSLLNSRAADHDTAMEIGLGSKGLRPHALTAVR